jgi:CheY-like chemotaxis protein/two-component sensor histidine kinase
MARLLDDLLDIARVMRGKIELRRENVELSQVIQHAVQTIQPLIDESGHELTVSIMSGPVTVNADPTRLEQVLVNLLNNAAKYTPRGGKMSIEVTSHESEVVISVSDTGDGIAPENLASVFDLFVQANRTLARSEGGLGIGLTLVRQLVEMHGGRVQAFSEGHSRGSRFVVHLPIMGGESCRAPITQIGNDPQRCRIVIVEDNADTREMLRCLLAMDGHEVAVAADGLSGVDAILSLRPDIALVDIGLPGIDGFELAEQVRAADRNRQIRLVAVTGYGQIGDMQQALNAGFDRHLVKPVKHEALIEVLGELVAAPPVQNRLASDDACCEVGKRPCAVH